MRLARARKAAPVGDKEVGGGASDHQRAMRTFPGRSGLVTAHRSFGVVGPKGAIGIGLEYRFREPVHDHDNIAPTKALDPLLALMRHACSVEPTAGSRAPNTTPSSRNRSGSSFFPSA